MKTRHKFNRRIPDMASAFVIVAVIVGSAVTVTAADPATMDLTYDLDNNTPYLMIYPTSLETVTPGEADLLKDPRYYKVNFYAGTSGLTLSDALVPQHIGLGLDMDGTDLVLRHIAIELETILVTTDSFVVEVTVAEEVRELLKLAEPTIGPTTVARITPKTARLVAPHFDADVDISRLEKKDQDGALKFATKLSGYFTDKLHLDLSSEGTVFLGTGGDTALPVPDGSVSFAGGLGYVLGPFDFIGGLDVMTKATFDNATESETRTLSVGAAATTFPRLDKVVGAIAAAINGRAVNFPPRLEAFLDYVNETDDPKNTLRGREWRWGVEANWRLELDEDYFVMLEWKYTRFDQPPLTDRCTRGFSYLDITSNYRLTKDLFLFVRYTDGELAPVYDQDNTVTMGFRYDIVSRKE